MMPMENLLNILIIAKNYQKLPIFFAPPRNRVSSLLTTVIFVFHKRNPVSLTPIATNGFHEAIAIDVAGVTTVFDNLYPQGKPLERWLED